MSSLETLYQNFQNAQIPREEWHHASHLGVALWVCSHYDEVEGLAILRDGIRRLNEAQGVENSAYAGYHETLTIFFARVVRAFWQEHQEQGLEAVYRLLQGTWGDKNRVFEFYPRRLLFSPQARAVWVEPLVADWMNVAIKPTFSSS